MFAIVSGANTGMGLEITRSLAEAGYDVLMACYDVKKGESAREMLIAQTGNKNLESGQPGFSARICRECAG